MSEAAGWIALAATCIAALMTAANLGARVTGWGFVVFTIGATAWSIVGYATEQTQLLWSNLFLWVVDVFGIWRWLGRQARFEDAAQAERLRSRRRAGADLFSVAAISGLPVQAADGDTVAHAVDALTECDGGTIRFLIIREGGVGGVGESLRRLPWQHATIAGDAIRTSLSAEDLRDLPLASTG